MELELLKEKQIGISWKHDDVDGGFGAYCHNCNISIEPDEYGEQTLKVKLKKMKKLLIPLLILLIGLGAAHPADVATEKYFWCHQPECWCIDGYKDCTQGNDENLKMRYFLGACDCTDYIDPQDVDYFASCDTRNITTVCVNQTCYATSYIQRWFPKFTVKECSQYMNGYLVLIDYYLGIPQNLIDKITVVR